DKGYHEGRHCRLCSTEGNATSCRLDLPPSTAVPRPPDVSQTSCCCSRTVTSISESPPSAGPWDCPRPSCTAFCNPWSPASSSPPIQVSPDTGSARPPWRSGRPPCDVSTP